LLRAELFNWLDVQLWAQLRMSESAYEQFVNLPQFAGEFSPSDRHEMTNRLALPLARLSWWQPDGITRFLSAEHRTRMQRNAFWDTPGWEQARVVINAVPTKGGTHVVYLHWMTWHE
jgi:hypothetical protein